MQEFVSTAKILEFIPYCDWSLRALVREGALKYGYHYIDKRLPGRKRPTYAFSILRMKEYCREKHDERLIG
jgi:hypothetical protein